MPVQNESVVTYLDQAEIDAGDLSIMERVAAGYWVISGGAVTAQGSPDGTVAVSSGTARHGGSNKTITAGNVSVLTGSANPDSSVAVASSATEARFDLITINTSSQLGVIHGTNAALSPNNDGSYLAEFPTISGVVLAAIFIPPNATVITSAMIRDKRIVGSVDAMHDQAHQLTGTNHSTGWGAKGSLPVGLTGTTGTTLAVGTNGQALVADSAVTEGVKWATSEDVSGKNGGLEFVSAVGATGSTETLSLTAGNVITATVDANCTFTMPSGLTSGKAISFTLILTDSGGPRTITFTGVKWNGGVDPTAMSAASAIDIYSFMTIDGGTTWYGFKAGTGMAT